MHLSNSHLNTCAFTHRLLPTLASEASLCSGKQLMQTHDSSKCWEHWQWGLRSECDTCMTSIKTQGTPCKEWKECPRKEQPIAVCCLLSKMWPLHPGTLCSYSHLLKTCTRQIPSTLHLGVQGNSQDPTLSWEFISKRWWGDTFSHVDIAKMSVLL